MKEAVGQTISLQIILVFMIFLNAFLALSVNYTKAFRVKNRVINELEQNEGLNTTAKKNIIEYMTKVGYNIPNIESKDGYQCNNGVCIMPVCTAEEDELNNVSDTAPKYKMYYRVKTYINVNLPIVKGIVDQGFYIFQVQGDTATIYVNASTCKKMEWGS